MAEQFAPIFPFFIITLWLFVCYIISKVGGWSALANHYKDRKGFKGKKWYIQSFSMGRSNYKSTAIIGANASHLYLSVILPFRFAHPKLIIPLSEVEGKEIKILFFRRIQINFKGVPKVVLKVSVRQANRIEQASKGAWTYERIQNEN